MQLPQQEDKNKLSNIEKLTKKGGEEEVKVNYQVEAMKDLLI